MESKILGQVRLLKFYAAAMTVAFAVLCLTALTPSAQKQKFQELDVERINIVDTHGTRQLVISNKDRFPEPVANGRELKGMRSIRPAGLVFYDTKGENEAGGLATFQTESGKNSLIAFDYATAEAIGFSRFESDDGKKYSAGFEVLDPPPPGTTIEEAGAKHRTRIAIQNENKDAQITLADADGKVRIKLKVAADGSANIQILDHDGKVVFTAPK
jgi:hypothetical protein